MTGRSWLVYAAGCVALYAASALAYLHSGPGPHHLGVFTVCWAVGAAAGVVFRAWYRRER